MTGLKFLISGGGSKPPVQVTAHDVTTRTIGKSIRRAGFDGDEGHVVDVELVLNDGAKLTFEVAGRDGVVTYTPPA